MHTMRRWPLLFQILAVNSAIVFLGAAAGTVITRRLAQQSEIPLTIMFATLGLLLSIAANYVLLRMALRPLLVLQTVAELVAQGELSVRAEENLNGEPNLARLAHTFNTMLDRLEEDTLDLERSRELTEHLTQQVISAQEEERRRIARELHDETAQSLATMALYIDTTLQAGKNLPSNIQQGLHNLRDVTDRTLLGVRAIIADLRPSLLDDLGLAAALRWQVQHRLEEAGIHVDLQVRGEGRRLPPVIETALYRLIQESITNILKHAHASYVEIDLDLSRDDAVTARIEDNGRGFDHTCIESAPQKGRGVGLFGMQERANLVSGTLQIDSAPGDGTEVRITIPLAASNSRPAGTTATAALAA
jgi:two-component system sensor histidine kinase UhpB